MEKRVGVITGATGGIGAAVAKALSEAGWRLILSGRSAEKLSALASQLGSPVAVMPGDLRDASLPRALLSAALEKFGRCDMCFNNAGILEVGPIDSIEIERVCEMVRVNVEGAFRVAYVFLQHFTQEKRGHLINVSSVLGKKVRPTAGAYAAIKFAMEALSEALRMELSKTDVQVRVFNRGWSYPTCTGVGRSIHANSWELRSRYSQPTSPEWFCSSLINPLMSAFHN